MSILKWNLKNIYLLPFIALILSVFGVLQAPKLKVNMDLSGLLSDENQAVREMNHVSSIVGGAGYLIGLVGPISSPEKYLPVISEVVKDHPRIKYSFYERETYQLKDKALYLLSKKEFKDLNLHAKVLFDETKIDTTGLGLFDEDLSKEEIEEEKEQAREFFRDLGNKMPNDKYFLSKDKMYAMILIKPDFDSTDLEKSEFLYKELTEKLNVKFGKNIPYQFSGRYVEKIQDKKQFDNDIAKTSIISTLALIIVLFFGLGSMRAGLFTIIGVFIAMGITVGLAAILVGRINILTGFLLAILSGLGSEYGIHYVRKFMRELHAGKNREEATESTYLTMSRSLLSAALTSAAAFFILGFSDFKGFSELGIIAGLGIVAIYFTFVCLFPFGAKFIPLKSERNIKTKFAKILYSFPFKTKYFYFYALLIPLVIFGLTKARFEFNFEKMHNFSKKTQETIKLTDELYGKAITPSAILTRDKEQVQQLESWLKNREHAEVIDQVVSYYTIIPDDMQSRAKKIENIKNDFSKIKAKNFERETSLKYNDVQKWLNTTLYGEEVIPLSLKENFGPDKNILLVFPKERQGTYEAITRYAETLNHAKKVFPGMEVGSDTLVFAAILNHIINDGKIVLIMFLIGAFFVFWPDFKSIKIALILESQLILGSVILVALMGLVDEAFTILNVAIIPAVLAAGIDMGVHQIHDEKEHGEILKHETKKRGPALLSARRIAGPIHLGMLCSICGFGALLFSEAKMLQGIGWISIFGQLSMYLVCMIIFPTMKDFFNKTKNEYNKKEQYE